MSVELRKGAFYWVSVVSNDTQEGLFQDAWQPARYTGKSADSCAREETRGDQIVMIAYSPDTWDFLGRLSADGHHFVEVVQVGPEIVPVL